MIVITESLQVNNEWLKWVRNSLHYSKQEVGKKLRIKPERITQWEVTGKILYDKLEKISQLYGVGTLTFFNDEAPPNRIEEIHDYRDKTNKNAMRTPDIYKEIRKAKTKRESILNYMEELGILFNDFQHLYSEKEKIMSNIYLKNSIFPNPNVIPSI